MSDPVKGQGVAIEGGLRPRARLGHRFAPYSPLAVLVPAGVSLLGLARRSRRLRWRDACIAAGIGGAVLLSLARWQLTRWFTEAPRYEVVRRVGARRDSALAAELDAIVRGAGLRPVGEVSFAFYDPPSTLPFLRRLEAWIEVVE